MSASGQQQEHSKAAVEEQDTTPNGVVEIDERRLKMERLRAEGIDPYPHVSLVRDRTLIKDVNEAHRAEELSEGGHPELRYHVAGRVISRREHPKTSFIDLRDLSGKLQIVVRLADLGQEAYDRVMSLDIGDIVGVEGHIYKTKRGELVLAVEQCTLLTKTLRPPPDKHHGLGDTGTRWT
jgi:lysyl-tRNA synthetase class 2